MASRRVILNAARLLEEEAELNRESCQITRPGASSPTDWACGDCDLSKCPTKKRYEELAHCARQLRGQA